LGYVFPGYSGYNPLDIVQGTDLPPNTGGGGANTVYLPLVAK
jgi:hypothetical protein